MQDEEVLEPIIGKYRNQIVRVPLDNRMHVKEFINFCEDIKPKKVIFPMKYSDLCKQYSKKSNI